MNKQTGKLLIGLALLPMAAVQGAIITQTDPSYVSIPAEAFDSIDDPTEVGKLWKLVSDGDLTTQGLTHITTTGVNTLSGALGGMAVYADFDNNPGTKPADNSNLNYILQLSNQATYSLYGRFTTFQYNNSNPGAGNMDSLYAPAAGILGSTAVPSTQWQQINNHATSTFGTFTIGNDASSLGDGWYRFTLGTYTLQGGDVNQPISFRIGMREAGLLADHFVLHTSSSLTSGDLSAIANIPEPSVYAALLGLIAVGLALIRRKK